MFKIGQTVVIKVTGHNMAMPNKHLNGMCLDHLNPTLEQLDRHEICTVIGRSEFYKYGHMLALKRNIDGGIFVAYEHFCEVISKLKLPKTTQSEAIEAFKMCIEAEIEMLYHDEWDKNYELPEDFYYDMWYEKAREEAYNLPHMLTLRNYIERNE